ncbi:hypothetical protein [Photobacterium leiognathi]|uniref:hypothetical protein n=1 Tax=Photobacterium leiognathi TaxID=553611 RepID=UPI002981A965|nr:hypothetical protein [Photobacterium leiognathi]
MLTKKGNALIDEMRDDLHDNKTTTCQKIRQLGSYFTQSAIRYFSLFIQALVVTQVLLFNIFVYSIDSATLSNLLNINIENASSLLTHTQQIISLTIFTVASYFIFVAVVKVSFGNCRLSSMSKVEKDREKLLLTKEQVELFEEVLARHKLINKEHF